MLGHEGPVMVEPPDALLTVIDCAVCGFAHLDPLPSPETIDAYYEDDRLYKDHAPSDWFDAETAQQYFWERVHKDWLNELELYGGKGQVLDLGCGAGWFLSYAKQLGWLGMGIEKSGQAMALVREKGVPVVHSYKELEGKKYDAVIMTLFLEHLNDPCGTLEWVRDMILRDDGLLLATVPNDFNPLQAVVRHKYGLNAWWVVSPHVNYFNVESFRSLIRDAGYEILEDYTTFPIEYMALQGHAYVGNEELGRWCYQRRMEFELAFHDSGDLETLRDLQHGWCDDGIGREIVVIARKT